MKVDQEAVLRLDRMRSGVMGATTIGHRSLPDTPLPNMRDSGQHNLVRHMFSTYLWSQRRKSRCDGLLGLGCDAHEDRSTVDDRKVAKAVGSRLDPSM